MISAAEFHDYSIETVRGDYAQDKRMVVFQRTNGGLSNVLMGLLSSYSVALALNLPLFCITLRIIDSVDESDYSLDSVVILVNAKGHIINKRCNSNRTV